MKPTTPLAVLLLVLPLAAGCGAGLERRDSRIPPDEFDTGAARAPAEPVPDAPPPPRPAAGQPAPGQPEAEADPSLRTIAFTTPTGRAVTLRYHQKSRSLGTADDGALDGGRCLKEVGPGFIHLNGKKDGASCATDETVNLLMFAIGEVLREYPDTAPVVIGGLSRPGGGPLRPHKSHTSGRDADLGYYALRNRPLAGFDDLPPTAIDFDKTFFLMANLIATGRVSHIFVNYSLQPGLYDAAKAMGYDDRQLAWIFQYPAGRKAKTGIVRHSKGHQRHWHVRFVCPVGDKDCL